MNVSDIEFRMRVCVRDDPQVYEVDSVGLYFDDMVTCRKPGDAIALYTFLAEDLRPAESEADHG